MDAAVEYVHYPSGRHCGDRVPLLYCPAADKLFVGEAGSYHRQLAHALGADLNSLEKGYLLLEDRLAGVRGQAPSRRMVDLVRATFRLPVFSEYGERLDLCAASAA